MFLIIHIKIKLLLELLQIKVIYIKTVNNKRRRGKFSKDNNVLFLETNASYYEIIYLIFNELF